MKTKAKAAFICCIPPFITILYGFFLKESSVYLHSLISIGCILAIFLIDKKFRLFKFPMFLTIIIFILLSLYFGRVLGAYGKVPYWDKFLHFSSGFIIVKISKILYKKLNGNPKNKFLLKFFSLSVATAAASLWEIFEFASDSIFKTAAQNNSLNDTMLDIIAGTISAVIAIFI